MPVERETGIEYEIIYSKRKTIGVKIDRDGKVFVHSPKRVPISEMESVIRKNASFILKHMEKSCQKSSERASFSVGIGSKILFLGEEYIVKPHEENTVAFDGESFLVPQSIDISCIVPSLVKLYKKLAHEYIKPIVSELSSIVGVTPAAVRINSAVTRWGSCSGKNTLNFSWRLIMADEQAVRYVVIHELCHIYEHNHSDRFWLLVEKYCPDYLQCEKSLKKLSERLSREAWE